MFLYTVNNIRIAIHYAAVVFEISRCMKCNIRPITGFD